MSSIKLDQIDLRILEALQNDARLTNLALADKAGISASPCLRRVRRMEEAGIILAYETRLNPSLIDLNISAFVSISVEKHGMTQSNRFQEELMSISEITAIYTMAGATDFILQVVAEDLKSYSSTIKQIGGIDGVRDIQSNIVIETVKTISKLPLDHLRKKP